jgi:hypothetical protein
VSRRWWWPLSAINAETTCGDPPTEPYERAGVLPLLRSFKRYDVEPSGMASEETRLVRREQGPCAVGRGTIGEKEVYDLTVACARTLCFSYAEGYLGQTQYSNAFSFSHSGPSNNSQSRRTGRTQVALPPARGSHVSDQLVRLPGPALSRASSITSIGAIAVPCISADSDLRFCPWFSSPCTPFNNTGCATLKL